GAGPGGGGGGGGPAGEGGGRERGGPAAGGRGRRVAQVGGAGKAPADGRAPAARLQRERESRVRVRRLADDPHGGGGGAAERDHAALRLARHRSHARVVGVQHGDPGGRQRAHQRDLLLPHPFDRAEALRVDGGHHGDHAHSL